MLVIQLYAERQGSPVSPSQIHSHVHSFSGGQGRGSEDPRMAAPGLHHRGVGARQGKAVCKVLL